MMFYELGPRNFCSNVCDTLHFAASNLRLIFSSKYFHFIQKRKVKRARTVSSMAAAINTVKKRLANTLGMMRPSGHQELAGPAIKARKQPTTPRDQLNDSRFRAGIARVSIFGNGLGLNYSPPV